MIRSKLYSRTSCDLVKSCLCRIDSEASARDVIKILLCEPDPSGMRRSSQLPLKYRIDLYQSPASENFIIRGHQGNNLLYQMGIDKAAQESTEQQEDNSAVNVNKPTAVQLSIVLLKLREQLPLFFNGRHDFNLYSSNIHFEYLVGSQLPMVMAGKQRYKIAVEMFRHVTCCMWASPRLEVIKITKVTDNGTIQCRWRVNGQLRGTFGKGKERILYDAFSIFTVDLNGLIYKHKLQKVCTVLVVILALHVLGSYEHNSCLWSDHGQACYHTITCHGYINTFGL